MAGINPGIIEAASANLAYASDPIPENLPNEIKLCPGPLELISDAARANALVLFVYMAGHKGVCPLPGTYVDEVLTRAGFINVSRETIVMRFFEHYPRRLLAGLEIPEIKRVRSADWALCLKESAFDAWLSEIAHRRSWPLDSRPRRGRGRPERAS
jgi:hypothetical protein